MPLRVECAAVPAGRTAFSLAFARRMHEPVDIMPVLIDEIGDPLGTLPSVRSGVGDRAAEPDIVAYVIDPRGVFEQLIDIGLTNAKPSVDVSPLVGLVPF